MHECLNWTDSFLVPLLALMIVLILKQYFSRSTHVKLLLMIDSYSLTVSE